MGANIDDRPETKKLKTPATTYGLENFAEDSRSSIPDSSTKEGLRSPQQNATDERNMPFGPGPKPPRRKAKTKYIHREIVDTGREPSEWYLNTRTTDKYARGDLVKIQYVKDIIKRCIQTHSDGGDVSKHTAELRSQLHEMEFYPFLGVTLIKKSKVLESEGLEKIFDSSQKDIFPWDVRADAEALWDRWMRGDLDADCLRGITVTKSVLASGSSRNSKKIDPTYAQRRSANVVGPNNLLNGQWWPSRVCMLRDGAHGEIEAGIHGQTDRGAYSVVLAAGGYRDKDNGDVSISYSSLSQTNHHRTFCIVVRRVAMRRLPKVLPFSRIPGERNSLFGCSEPRVNPSMHQRKAYAMMVFTMSLTGRFWILRRLHIDFR
jgi:hypothetical protein